MSGSLPGLGCSDPERAVPLVTSPSTYPWWSPKKSVFLSGEKGAVTYRYCVFSGGKFSRWEGEGKLWRDLEQPGMDKEGGIGRVTSDVLDTPQDHTAGTDQQLVPSPGGGTARASVSTATEVRVYCDSGGLYLYADTVTVHATWLI